MKDLSRRLLPSISALSAFDAVARRRSFTLAADELSLTQSAVSHQISALETQLNTRLVNRTTRGVTLTPEGRAYAVKIAEAVRIIREASLTVMTNRYGHVLNLAILPTFGTRWLMPRLPRFIERHPEITLNFVTRIGRVDFQEERLDAAIHVGEPDWPATDFMPLFGETIVPVASPDFLAATGLQRPADLARAPLLHLASRPNAWQRWFASLGLPPPQNEGLRFEQFSMLAQACGAGIGVALLPKFLIDAELRSGDLTMVFDHSVESPSAYYLATPTAAGTGKPSRPQIDAFSSWLQEEAALFDPLP